MARYVRLFRHSFLCSVAVPAFLLALAGCTPPAKPAMPAFNDTALAEARETFARIDEQNRTTKRSPEWIANAYRSLKIRQYRSLDAEARQSLKAFVQDNEVYIIVHPAYYTFFMHNYGQPPL